MTTRTDPEKHKEQVRAANRARHRATKRLIANHRSEFDALYSAEAEREGVTPKPVTGERNDMAELRSEIAELKAALTELTTTRGKRR